MDFFKIFCIWYYMLFLRAVVAKKVYVHKDTKSYSNQKQHFQVTQIKHKLTFYALWTFSDIIVPLIRVLKKKHLKALGKIQSQRYYIHFNILCNPMNIQKILKLR